jgi:hypothetical protein
MRSEHCALIAGGGHYKGRLAIARAKSALIIIVIATGRDAEIVITAKVDIIVRRIAVLIDVLNVFEIIIAAQIGIGVDIDFLLDFLKRNRLLGLEHRLGRPGFTAFDAGNRVFLAKIVESFPALGAGTLGTPFRLRHYHSSKHADPYARAGRTAEKSWVD